MIFFILRLLMYKQKRNWLKNIVFFFMFVGMSFNLVQDGATSIGMALTFTLMSHWLAKVINKRVEAKRAKKAQAAASKTTNAQPNIAPPKPTPPKTNPPKQEPVKKDPPKPNPPKQEPVKKDPPKPNPPKQESVKKGPPKAEPPKTETDHARQTLRSCLRCGHGLSGKRCRSCGFDHTTQSVYMLRFVNPERMQIKDQ